MGRGQQYELAEGEMGRGQQYESGSHSAQFQFHGAHTRDHPVYFWQGSRLKAKC